MAEWIKKKVPHWSYICIGHETGETGYEHTHAFWKSKKKKDIKNARFFDWNDIHPQLQPHKSPEHEENQSVYPMKEDEIPLVEGTYETEMTWGSAATLIEESSSWGAIIRNETLMKFLGGRTGWAQEIWNSRELQVRAPETLRLHQQEWLVKLNAQNNRKILWICDRVGGWGKTRFCHWLVKHENAFYCDGGKYADIVKAYDGQKVIIFDFKRSMEAETWSYKAIEAFKDGLLFSGKYQSTMKCTPADCKVLICSNAYPDVTKMSGDRWEILHYKEEWQG